MNKRNKLLLLSGIALLVLGMVGTAVSVFLRTTPEKRLYRSMAADPFAGDAFVLEKSIGNGANKIAAESIFKKDGTSKGEGTLTCSGSSEYGKINLRLAILQVQESMFMRYEEIRFSESDDKTIESEANDFYKNEVQGKWILLEDEDPQFMGYKEYGVVFTMGGAVSKKLSPEQLVEKLKAQKVITILDAKKIAHEGASATEYSLLVRRSAYEKFMDSVEPQFKYKDQILDNLFDDDTEEMSVIIDNKSGRVVSSTYSMENLCATFTGAFNPDAAADMPTTMRITMTSSATGKVDKLAKPTEHITLKQLDEILYAE